MRFPWFLFVNLISFYWIDLRKLNSDILLFLYVRQYSRATIWGIVKSYGIQPWILMLIRDSYNSFEYSEVLEKSTSNSFEDTFDLRQIYSMSPILFSLVIDRIKRHTTSIKSTGIHRFRRFLFMNHIFFCLIDLWILFCLIDLSQINSDILLLLLCSALL